MYGLLASSLNLVRHLRKWRIGNVATLAEVQDEVDGERPLCARVAYDSGGAHFITIVGYLPDSEELAGSRLIAIEDPFRGSSDGPLRRLVRGPPGGALDGQLLHAREGLARWSSSLNVRLTGISADWAFLGAAAIEVGGAFTSADPYEAEVKRAMIKAARRTAVLADETKFGTRRFAAFARAEDIDCLVRAPPAPRT